MGDSNRIDILRALALSSMPSLARRPVQRQNSRSIDVVEQRKFLVSSNTVKADDKEEGELSSDDEVQCSATPFAALEPSLSFAHRNAGLSLHAPSQGNLKDERHTSAATSAESVPHVGVSSASAFSTSTRVSIVNKSQLLSAFSAQAPPLISSQIPESVHNGSGLGRAAKRPKQNLVQVTSSGTGFCNFIPSSTRTSLEIASTATLQLTSNLPELSLSQASPTVPIREATIISSPSTQSPILFPTQVPSSTLPNGESSVLPTAVATVTRDVSPVLVPFAAIGESELTGVAPGQGSAVSTAAVAATGPDASAAVGTGPAETTFATPTIGGVVVRKEAGVQKEAETFLASLCIPLSNSSAPGEEKEDAFVIKFDEDSDSDGESENHSKPTSRVPGRNVQKGTTRSSVPMNVSVLSQSNPVIPNQSSSNLKSEIDRMKKQIAAMERTKGKTSAPSVLGKSRVLSAMLPPATEPKAGTLLATHVRPASVDLESMRLRIAAKESELQKRRQALAVKGTESGKGANDLKGTGGVLTSYLPPTLRAGQPADCTNAPVGNLIGKASFEKGSSEFRKEVQARPDGIPALALAGPGGTNLSGFKNNAERRVLDKCNDQHHLNDHVATLTPLQASTHVSDALGQQSVAKGIKRSQLDAEIQEVLKVPRFENTSLLEKSVAGEFCKEAAMPYNTSDSFEGVSCHFPSSQISSQLKRKLDAAQPLSGTVVSGIMVNFTSPTGFETTKKLKTNSRIISNSGRDVRDESVVNSEQYAHRKGHLAAIVPPTSDAAKVSTILSREKRKSSSPSSDTLNLFAPSSLGYLTTAIQATSDVLDGTVGISNGERAASLSTPLPAVSENGKGLIAVQKNPDDVLTSSNGIKNTGVNEDTEVLGRQQAIHGPRLSHFSLPTFGDSAFTASLPQSVAKVRHDKQIAHCTAMAFTEHQPKTLGMSNRNSALSTENNRGHTTISWRPVNPVSLHAPTNLAYQINHSFQPGNSRIDNQLPDAEHDSFQHLLEEEELLDKRLEEVQHIRQRCEQRERVSRRKYREAQHALQAANADCDALNQRKEFLLSQIHAAEARRCAVRSYLDCPLIPFGGTFATYNQNKDANPPPLVSAPNLLPVMQAAGGSWEVDVNGEQDLAGQVHESMSPISSSRVEIAVVAHRDVQSGVSTGGSEDYPSCTWAKRISSDGKEQEPSAQMIAGVECSGRMEDHSVVGEKRLKASLVNVGREEEVEAGAVVDASQAGTQYLSSCINGLNNIGQQNSPSAVLENASLEASNFAVKGENRAISRMFGSDTRAVELSASTLQDSEPVPSRSLPLSIIGCSRQYIEPCSIDHIGVGDPSIRVVTSVSEKNVGHPVLYHSEGPILSNANQVMSRDVEQPGSDQEYHDVQQINALTTSQDAPNVDLFHSVPDIPTLVKDLESTDTHESLSMEEGNLSVDDTLQDDLSGNAPSMNHQDISDPRCLEGSTVGASISSSADGDCCFKSKSRELSLSMLKDCACEELPEGQRVLQEVVFLNNAAVEACKNGRGYTEEPGCEPTSFDVSHNIVAASAAREDGTENIDLEAIAEGSDNGFLSENEPRQCSSHLPPVANKLLPEIFADGDFEKIKSSQWALPNLEQNNPATLADSSIIGLFVQPEEWKVRSLNQSTEEGVSSQLIHSAGVPDGFVVLDKDMQHGKDVGSSEETPGVLVVEDVEFETRASQGKDVGSSEETLGVLVVEDVEFETRASQGKDVGRSEETLGVLVVEDVEFETRISRGKMFPAPEQGSHLLEEQEDSEGGLLRDGCQGGLIAESEDIVSGNYFRKLSPGTTNLVCQSDILIPVNQDSQPPSDERDNAGDISLVTIQHTNARSDNGSRPEGAADCVGEPQHGTSEVAHLSPMEMSFDDNSTVKQVLKGFHSENRDLVQDGCEGTCTPVDPVAMTGNHMTLSYSEIESQEDGLVVAVGFECQQQDPLNVDHSDSGELKSEDAERKESKGAEVETFHKALLDGNAFERRSSSDVVVDAINSLNLNRTEASEEILPQLQHHRLEHLLDMVEVTEPEMSLVSHMLVQDDTQGLKSMASPVVVDDAVQLDPLTLESCGTVSQCIDQTCVPSKVETTLPPGVPVENISNAAEKWVPSAVSLAVLSCIQRVAPTPSESDNLCGVDVIHSEERDSQTTFGASGVPFRYESPLSVFRSYRICPQFSDDLHLSCSSSTWSHAINPFNPLCKFEHRGKCNNDDCPWQHADDYTISSTHLESQMQNYADQSQMNADDHDVGVTRLHNNAELAATAISLPTSESPVTAIIMRAQLPGQEAIFPNVSILQSPLPMKWIDRVGAVPIYRTGSYTLKPDNPSRMCLLSYSLQFDRKVDSFQSFLLSPSIHRPLPADMPCLLDKSGTLSLFSETPAFHPGSPHWRYTGDIQEKLICTKDGRAPQEMIDEEVWLELALHHIDYDISTENFKARDQALFYLSRALESKRRSVSLWVVYSCLFHMRKENPEKDDMFHYAVQYNQGSYELWVLYINSRSDYQSRMEAYEKAIAALVDEGTQTQLDQEELSVCVLDIGLQMLYFWCVSGCPQDSFLWVDDLICEASTQDDLKPHRASTAALLSHLTQHDACILWIACTYFLACSQLPPSIITRLGCKQELPDGLNWEKHAKVDEVSHKRVIKALSTAASQGLGCLSMESVQAVVENDNFPRQVLGVNYVHCLALYEGLDSAACLGQKLMSLHPTSLELIAACARIDERRQGPLAGLQVFEDALLRWPTNASGVQRLWNQYAGHAFLWGGQDLGKSALLKCIATKNMHSIKEVEVSPWRSRPVQAAVSMISLEQKEGMACKENSGENWNRLREYFVALTSTSERMDCGTTSSYQLCLEDSIFSLINLALVEALSGDIAASQCAINRAMKAAISHKDLRHCWRELVAFQQVFLAKFPSREDSKMLEQTMLSLLDRCKTDSHILSQLIPLSQKAFQNFKKPHVRKFFDDLVGPPPLDHYVLNCVLNMFYGPQLLPSDSHALKKVFHFAEGILEAMPGNVQLALSLCKIVQHNSPALKGMYMAAAIWASVLLTSALHQSCPLAPEVYWVEAGLILKELGEEKSLEEFYGHALGKYPFSAALQHGLKEVQGRLQISDAFPQGANQQSLNLVVPEPIQVDVQC